MLFVLSNSPLIEFWGLGSIHNIYNVPMEPERAAKARRAVVASVSKIRLESIDTVCKLPTCIRSRLERLLSEEDNQEWSREVARKSEWGSFK